MLGAINVFFVLQFLGQLRSFNNSTITLNVAPKSIAFCNMTDFVTKGYFLLIQTLKVARTLTGGICNCLRQALTDL